MATSTDPGSGISSADLAALGRPIRADEAAYLAYLERLVNIDCGSYTPAGVDRVGEFVAAFLRDSGATVEVRPDPGAQLGATVIGTWTGDTTAAGAPRLLLIGHMDTVFDPGTAAERPFSIDAD